MGNAYPSVFGAYVDSYGNRKLNPSLQKMFGTNYDAALQYQKRQIVSLINAGTECPRNQVILKKRRGPELE